jgi:NTP pyrophosphatase (non-canonical NTP hydrolase)
MGILFWRNNMSDVTKAIQQLPAECTEEQLEAYFQTRLNNYMESVSGIVSENMKNFKKSVLNSEAGKEVFPTTQGISIYQWQQMVLKLAKPGAAILESLDPAKVDLMHAAVGISGEAGELLDAVKKAVIYNKPLDVQNIIEELGDLEFYMEQLRNNILLLITREVCLRANYEKLNKRYKNGYSDSAAQQRADKNSDPNGKTVPQFSAATLPNGQGSVAIKNTDSGLDKETF